MCVLTSGLPWEGARILQLHYHSWWIMDFGVGPQDKTPKSGWHTANSPRPKKARINKSKIKSMFFFTVRGSSTRNLCHQDKLFIRKSLKDSGKGWHMCDQALHALGCCTTTTPHVTRQSPSMNFGRKSISVVPQSPYSPDLSPCDFVLFPRLKNHLKGRHFVTLDNIQKSITYIHTYIHSYIHT